MSENLDRAKRHHAAIHDILLHQWDPIGVAGTEEARDEYDSYIRPICSMLIRNEPKHKLFDFLWRIETENMGLSGNRKRAEDVADQLLQVRTKLDDAV